MTGVHLIGSVPLPDTDTVFGSVARELGPYLARIPDGETGKRGRWALVAARNAAFLSCATKDHYSWRGRLWLSQSSP